MPDLAGARVLLTGVAGFVGARLARALLAQGAEVHGLLSPDTDAWRLDTLDAPARGAGRSLHLHRLDLLDYPVLQDVVDAVRPQYVLNLARRHCGPSLAERVQALCNNTVGVMHLLEATSRHKYLRLVHLGSSTEYGPRGRPLLESDALAPRSFYGVTKAASSLLCQQWAHAQGLPIVVLRPFLAYGYGEPPSQLIPVAVRALLSGGEIALTGSGCRRDWVFVDDLVDACLLALGCRAADGEVINVGSGQQWANEEVVALLEQILGVRARLCIGGYPEGPWDAPHWVADLDKAHRLLGWKPRHTLPEALEQYVPWLRDSLTGRSSVPPEVVLSRHPASP